jgi:hypothetical protein
MNIDEKEFKLKLTQAECDGVRRARNTLIFIYKQRTITEQDIVKRSWLEEEAKRLADDNRWNTIKD